MTSSDRSFECDACPSVSLPPRHRPQHAAQPRRARMLPSPLARLALASPARAQGGAEAMASHVDLLDRTAAAGEGAHAGAAAARAQKRRAQQLKKWAQYEQDLQHRKRKHERKRSTAFGERRWPFRGQRGPPGGLA